MKSLPAGSRFNIISFGIRYEVLFDAETLTVPYTDQTLAQAVNTVGTMEATFGGTELAEPMQLALSGPIEPGTHRSVFVLTDGQVCIVSFCV